LPCLKARIALLILAFSIVSSIITPVVWAPTVESYLLTISPSRVQQSVTTEVILSLRVTNASTFTNYGFTWTVVDPSGTSRSATNSTNSGFSTSFTLSADFPKSFVLETLRYVGNYTVRVDETNPASKPNVASGFFQVGLTDSATYRRTDTTSVQAIGYRPGENVTISLTYSSNSVPGFPTWGAADSNGILSYLWQSPPGASTGSYNVTLQGSITSKTVSDTQLFLLSVTNITIPQLMVSRTTLQRTETQVFTFNPTYLSGVAVQSGSVAISVVEPDSITTHSTTASYNPTTGGFQANYRIPLTSETGAWASSIRASTFNDGYGNTGPLVGVTKGFNVQMAQLAVSVSITNKTYGPGDVMAVYAIVLGPDGTPFTSGNVTAIFSPLNSATRIGSGIPLYYIASQAKWVGSTVINSTNPAGVWLVSVNASDTYKNTGQGSTVALVNNSLIQPSSQPLNLYYFLLVAGIVAAGLGGTLVFRRLNSTDGSFDELYSLTGGQFQPPTTLMIRGESGSGATTLGLELVFKALQAGRSAVILTYDSFPSEIQRQMMGMGWDVQRYIENGSLQFIDCYSALVGGETSIKDPVDFTEVSIQVSNKVENAKGPVTVFLDSFTPIFNSAQVRHAINFLRVLGAKIKNDGGFFIMSGTRGSLPESIESNLESVVDSVIDLHVSHRGHRLVRLLTVKKVAGHQIDFVEKEFRIVQGKGILFRTPRVTLGSIQRR
jgi:archaeal flagellar protein FlaH